MIDMQHVMDQVTGYAQLDERAGRTQSAQTWRDKRWSRLDQEVEWAKQHNAWQVKS